LVIWGSINLNNGRKGEAPHLKHARIVVIDTAAPLARPFLPALRPEPGGDGDRCDN